MVSTPSTQPPLPTPLSLGSKASVLYHQLYWASHRTIFSLYTWGSCILPSSNQCFVVKSLWSWCLFLITFSCSSYIYFKWQLFTTLTVVLFKLIQGCHGILWYSGHLCRLICVKLKNMDLEIVSPAIHPFQNFHHFFISHCVSLSLYLCIDFIVLWREGVYAWTENFVKLYLWALLWSA